MVKKLQKESVKQPVRQSHRTRVLNTRLGTPPKILLDMLGDHSPSMVNKSLSAVANIERIENIPLKAARIPIKQNVKSPSINVQLSYARPRRQHNPSKRYAAPFEEMLEPGYFSKRVLNETVEITAAFTSNESTKFEVPRSSRNERMHISSKTLNSTASRIRHSSRIRIPNPRFGYLLPGFLEQAGNKKERDSMKRSDGRKMDMLSLMPKEVSALTPEIACGKSDMTIGQRHSKRQRIPSKRLSFPYVYPITQAQKTSTKARPKMKLKRVDNCKNSNKKPVSILKTRLSAKDTSRNLSLSSITSNRQVHSSVEVPSVLYPYRPARSQAFCVEPSSSMTKDYVSKKDVEELLVEINIALARVTDKDCNELREKISHHLNNLHRENCRFRQALHQLRSELDSLSSNSTVNSYNILLKQNGELREQKVLADIKCKAQVEEVRKLLERVRILEVRNKNLENFWNRFVKQKKQQNLNGETKYPHTGLANDLSKMEAEDLMDPELDSLILNGTDGGEVVKGDKSNDNEAEWGNDSWMLHC